MVPDSEPSRGTPGVSPPAPADTGVVARTGSGPRGFEDTPRPATVETALGDYLAQQPAGFAQQPAGPIKLHLGCGGMRWQDFVNVDLYPADPDVADSSRDGCVADVYQDIRALNLPANSVAEIFSAHVIEHFPRWEALEILRHWCDVLEPGGQLVIETPDFRKCVMWLFHPKRAKRELARTQFYGNQWDRIDFETHRYVWTLKEMSAALRDCGFSSVRGDHRALTHHAGRDMRVVAIK